MNNIFGPLAAVCLVVTSIVPPARAAEVADSVHGPGAVSAAQRNPDDFSLEYRCANAVMGEAGVAGQRFGKLMRRVSANVIMMPVSQEGKHGYYMITPQDATFYVIDPNGGTPLLVESDRMYNFRFSDPGTREPFGLSVTITPSLFNTYDVPKDKLTGGQFAETAIAPTGKKAHNNDAANDVVKNLVASLEGLPERMFPETPSVVSYGGDAEANHAKKLVADVLCTCGQFKSSPDLMSALNKFKKNLKVAPYTTEDCSPTAKASGVRTF